MSAALIFEIKGSKKDKSFNFLKGSSSVMGGPMDVIFSVFSEAYVRLLKRNFGIFKDIVEVITI